MHNKPFTVLSFNLKRDGPLSHITHMNRWELRKNYVAAIIKGSGAAVVGVQEMMPDMRDDLQALLPDYSIFGVSRRKNNNSEHSDILIHNHFAQIQHYQTFWLSKHPQRAGSRAYFAAFPRICTVAEIILKETGQQIRVFNTHFDHICGSARTLGMKTILKYMESFQKERPMPTILMGDFNAKPNSKPFQVMKAIVEKNPQLSLQNVFDNYAKITNTHHSFKGKMNHTIIDYILISRDLQVIRASVDKSVYGGNYPSDHYPIVATLAVI